MGVAGLTVVSGAEMGRAEWAAALAAAPAERMVFAAVSAVAKPFAGSLRLPAFDSISGTTTLGSAPAVPSPRAEPAAREVVPAAAHEFAVPAAFASLPALQLAADEPDELSPEMEFAVPPRLAEVWLPSAAAEAAERMARAICTAAEVAFPVPVQLPSFRVQGVRNAGIVAADLQQGFSAEPAESMVVAADALGTFAPSPIPALVLPALGRLADVPVPFVPSIPATARPEPAEPALVDAEALWREQRAAFPSRTASLGLTIPALSAASPEVGGRAGGPQADALEAMPARDRFEPAALASPHMLALPVLREFPASANPWIAEPVQAPAAEAAESLPHVPPFVAVPAIRPAALAIPPIRSHETPELGAAEFNALTPGAAIPHSPAIRRLRAGSSPISTVTPRVSGQPERPHPAIPAPGLVHLEFYCQRISARPMARLTWSAPGAASATPLPFSLAPARERAEEVQPLKPEARVKGQIAEILSHPEAIALRARNRKLGRYGKIAACLMVAGSLWLGARVVNFGRPSIQAPAIAAVDVTARGPAAAAPARSQGGALATVRRVLASRAATEAADNFRGGMEAWGAEPKSWAKGWSRHPDGYVHPGDLALFHPSLTYKDYRMEFYGQIEQKSMDWVVRASDKENYYAMKFKVVAPGIRPVIAMVHYPVVGGKAGHRVETPLNVMIHNNRPYHVTVDVKGSRYTASIEGEPVESWTDNTLLAGGVGFFSEAGERARVYWMRVSKNQDWIGRVCAFISGTPDDGPKTIAEFWPPAFPTDVPAPERRQRNPEMLFGAVVLGGLPGRFRQVSSNLRRVRLCRS